MAVVLWRHGMTVSATAAAELLTCSSVSALRPLLDAAQMAFMSMLLPLLTCYMHSNASSAEALWLCLVVCVLCAAHSP